MNAVPRGKSKGGDTESESISGQLSIALGTASSEQQLPFASKCSNSTLLELHGVPLYFPFEPYPCQKDYMASVLKALHLSENCLLESPTGTGKTLCLLCSTLAWQIQHGRSQPEGSTPARNTIVYASRTHSQLSQVARELKNTRYRPKHTVVASREQLCIHDNVSAKTTATAMNNECSRLNKERKCRFRNNLDRFGGPSNIDDTGEPPLLDVEELRLMGKKHNICPFYYARDSVKDCDLVLVPYNYLFDKEARSSLEIQWKDAILIFDEAHNLESFASDATSFDLTGLDIAGAITEVSRGVDLVTKGLASSGDEEGIKVDNLIKLKAMLLRIEEFLDRGVPAEGGSFEDFLRRFSEIIMQAQGGLSSGTPKLDHIIACIRRAFAGTSEAQCLAKARAYRVHISPKKNATGTSTSKKEARTLSYWCFAPSLAMRELADLGLRSIIVTSGTLSPIKSYSLELGIPFPITLENPHIIKPNQVYIRVVGRGVSEKSLKSTFERRDDKDYIIELGNTLVALSRVIPGGLLIFYPSYSVMEKCVDEWGGPLGRKWFDGGHKKMNNFFSTRTGNRNSSVGSTESFSFPLITNHYQQEGAKSLTIWKRLLSQKAIVIEPRSASEMKEAILEFDKHIDGRSSKGCILMGVCRGKISEGIDFADHRARAVIITGIPFPPFQDPKVKLKREFLDASKANAHAKPSEDGGFSDLASYSSATLIDAQSISGGEWYSQQALRAVNQAVGRVIRHRFDYGAVLLLDSRFGEPRNQDGMSKWVRPYIQPDDGFGKAISSLAKFYRDAANDPHLTITNGTASRTAKDVSKASKNVNNFPILRYEADSKSDVINGADQEANINITVVQAVTRELDLDGNVRVDSMGGDAAQRDSYISADRVIKRIELKKADLCAQKAVNFNIDCVADRECSSIEVASGLNALFKHDGGYQSSTRADNTLKKKNTLETGVWENLDQEKPKGVTLKIPPISISATSCCKAIADTKGVTIRKTPMEKKEAAINFFKAAQSCMKTEDFKSLRVLVAKMKDAGDIDDFRAYLVVAKEMVELLLKMDGVHDLIILLLPLLSQRQRSAVQAMALEMRAQKDKELKPSYHGAKLMKSALFRTEKPAFKPPVKNDIEVQDEEMRLREKEVGLINAERATQAAKKRVREVANEKLCSGLATNNIAALRGQRLLGILKSSTDSNVSPSGCPSAHARKSLLDTQKQLQVKTSEKSDYVDLNIAQCMKQVSAVSYLTDNVGDASSSRLRIKSNAPKDLICTICEVSLKEPMAAECNHYACKRCWQQWLVKAQNSTCPVCRKPARISTLSLVVFERETGAGVPTLTQLRANDFSSDDDT